jgi:hypothetical protein
MIAILNPGVSCRPTTRSQPISLYNPKMGSQIGFVFEA